MGNDEMTFDTFWQLYPRHENKRYAERCWRKLTETEKQLALAAIHNHVRVWQAEEREHRFIPVPSTWINQARWEDELIMPKPVAHQMSQSSWLERGAKMGILPKPGESQDQFQQRIMSARH